MTRTPWGGVVVARASTPSTMDEAEDLERQGAPDGSLVWAEHQTQGRGRHAGRVWQAEPGTALLFTVFWNPARFRGAFAASLTVGLGVCLWLESLNLGPAWPVRLKWPNDILLAGAKVAGILVRQRWTPEGPGRLHAGIGVNLTSAPPPAGLNRPAAHLAQTGLILNPAQALDGLLPCLALALDEADPHGACSARLAGQGQTLSIRPADGEPEVSGLCEGLDPRGALLLRTAQGLRVLSSGE